MGAGIVRASTVCLLLPRQATPRYYEVEHRFAAIHLYPWWCRLELFNLTGLFKTGCTAIAFFTQQVLQFVVLFYKKMQHRRGLLDRHLTIDSASK